MTVDFLNYKVNYEEILNKIIGLKNEDLALRDKLVQSRKLSKGYNKEMKKT